MELRVGEKGKEMGVPGLRWGCSIAIYGRHHRRPSQLANLWMPLSSSSSISSLSFFFLLLSFLFITFFFLLLPSSSLSSSSDFPLLHFHFPLPFPLPFLLFFLFYPRFWILMRMEKGQSPSVFYFFYFTRSPRALHFTLRIKPIHRFHNGDHIWKI